MIDKELLPSSWIKQRVLAYIEDGKTSEHARYHAIMDYLDEVYKEGFMNGLYKFIAVTSLVLVLGFVVVLTITAKAVKHNAVIESTAIQEVVGRLNAIDNRLDAISHSNSNKDAEIVDLNYRVEDIINKIKQMEMDKNKGD